MNDLKSFLSILFDEGQATCFSHTAEGIGVHLHPIERDIFFSINAIHPYKDANPTQTWHDAHKPRRADHNVVCYRNFLLEVDKIPLAQQREYLESRIPFSTLVYSGGKSMHAIISLETPLQTPAAYRDLARRIHAYLPEIDHTTKNPSRLSRLPFRMRPDTNKLQSLEYLGARVPFEKLGALLPPAPKFEPQISSAPAAYLSPTIIWAVSNPDAAMAERHISGRNAFFYWLYNRMQDCQLGRESRVSLVERAYANLKDTTGFSISEAYHAARILK